MNSASTSEVLTQSSVAAVHKAVTLKLNKEFKHAYYQGKFKAHPFLITYMVRNRVRCPRIGITSSKKTGCAVKRNRARRIIRQSYFELLREGLVPNTGFDYVFVSRADTIRKKTQDIKAVMKKQIMALNSPLAGIANNGKGSAKK